MSSKEKVTQLERNSKDIRELVKALGIEIRYQSKGFGQFLFRCGPKHSWWPLVNHSEQVDQALEKLKLLELQRQRWPAPPIRARNLRLSIAGASFAPTLETDGVVCVCDGGDEGIVTVTSKYVVVELRLVHEQPLEIHSREDASQLLEEAMLDRWGSDSVPGATTAEQKQLASGNVMRLRREYDRTKSKESAQRLRDAEKILENLTQSNGVR